jgi:hypothetical protein
MTLAEFLLARIADDEVQARFVQAEQNAGPYGSASSEWGYLWHDEYDLLYVAPARVLAECEAKRRIVELWQAVGGEQDDAFDRVTFYRTVRVLALPYSAHADYQDNWRP